MPKIIKNNIVYGSGAKYVELTQLQYDQLTDAEKHNGKMYFITDANGDGSDFQPVIYSEIEREIGVYIDGKSLYEKSYYVAQLPSVEDNVDIPYDVANLGDVISLVGIMINSTSHMSIQLPYLATSPYDVQLTAYDTYIRIAVHTDRSAWKSIVTIRYTKTTDVPGGGTWTPQGVPASHYSTYEHVVGTWIDGSTLYEKTVYSAGGVTGDFTMPHNISNIDRVISYTGTVKDTAYSTYGDIWVLPRMTSPYLGVDRVTSTDIAVVNPSAFSTRLVDWYITIRYTKSSS